MITVNDINRFLRVDGIQLKAKDAVGLASADDLRVFVAFLIGKLDN